VEVGVELKTFWWGSEDSPELGFWVQVVGNRFAGYTTTLFRYPEDGAPWVPVLVGEAVRLTRRAAFGAVQGLVHSEQDRLILGGERFDAAYAQDVIDDLDLLIVEAGEVWF